MTASGSSRSAITAILPTVSYTRGSDLSGSLEGAGGIGGLLARSSGYSGGQLDQSQLLPRRRRTATSPSCSTPTRPWPRSYRYDPFGNTLSSSGTLAGANVYRFSSKEIHVNSGMYYYGYRFYDPSLQRWINRDPIGEQTRAQAFLSETAGIKSNANPMPLDALEGPNPYAFVHNQPTSGYDGDGLLAESPGVCIAARISANILRRLMRRYPANTYYSALYTYAAAAEICMLVPRYRRDQCRLYRRVLSGGGGHHTHLRGFQVIRGIVRHYLFGTQFGIQFSSTLLSSLLFDDTVVE